MIGNADGDGIQPGADQQGDAVVQSRQHHGQGPRPEGFGQGFGRRVEADGGARLSQVPDVDDQRVEPGPVLSLEDAGDGFVVCGVGAEAIDGFGGKGDKPALAEAPGGGGNIVGVGGNDGGSVVGHGQPEFLAPETPGPLATKWGFSNPDLP